MRGPGQETSRLLPHQRDLADGALDAASEARVPNCYGNADAIEPMPCERQPHRSGDGQRWVPRAGPTMQAPSKRQRRRLLQLLAFRAARLGVDVGVLQLRSSRSLPTNASKARRQWSSGRRPTHQGRDNQWLLGRLARRGGVASSSCDCEHDTAPGRHVAAGPAVHAAEPSRGSGPPRQESARTRSCAPH
jgi:hypothetical protein